MVLDWEEGGAAGAGERSDAGVLKKTLPGEVTEMRASGKTGWFWTGKKAARKGTASEAMPGYYKKSLWAK